MLVLKKAAENEEPLPGSLEIASMNIQPAATLDKLAFQNISLSGSNDALPLDKIKRIYFNNCSLSEIPAAVVGGDSVTVIDVAGDTITNVDTEFQSRNLTLLYLHGNLLQIVPTVIFSLSTLQYLTLANNPINASGLTMQQLTFLSTLRIFTIDGMTNTSACPPAAVQSALTDYFTFRMGTSEATTSANSTLIEQPLTSPPVTTELEKSSTSSHEIWIILGASLGASLLLLLLGINWWCYRLRRDEPPKLMNSTTQTIGIGMGDLSEHPYMGLQDPFSNASSQTTSDFELLASVADG